MTGIPDEQHPGPQRLTTPVQDRYLVQQASALIGLWNTHNLLSENAKITASNLLH